MLQPPPTSERIATLQVNDQICVLSFGDWSHVQEARRVLRRMGAPLGGADRSEAVLAAAHVIFVHEALVVGEQSFGGHLSGLLSLSSIGACEGDDPLAFVVSMNLRGGDISTKAQRAVIAAETRQYK